MTTKPSPFRQAAKKNPWRGQMASTCVTAAFRNIGRCPLRRQRGAKLPVAVALAGLFSSNVLRTLLWRTGHVSPMSRCGNDGTKGDISSNFPANILFEFPAFRLQLLSISTIILENSFYSLNQILSFNLFLFELYIKRRDTNYH